MTTGWNGTRRFALALAIGSSAGAASAGQILLGLGAEGLFETEDVSPAVALDLWSEPIFELGPIGFGLGAAAQIDAEADIWLGGGPVAYLPVTERLRVEGGAMPGIYFRNEGADLGDDLLFRLQLGASYAVAPDWRVGAYLEHKSNASTAEINPGTESAWLRLGREF